MRWRERTMSRYLLTVVLLLAPAAVNGQVRGVVATVDGEAISGAVVEGRGEGGRQTVRTDDAGRFEVQLEPPLSLRVSAQRFVGREVTATAAGEISIALERQSITAESITVAASRAGLRIVEAPTSTVVVTQQDLAATASPTLDDALRTVPGFTLFRRSGSRTANPTAQGVSLRGVGASGASRSVVLDEGIPLNDPFGGWVYWGRVPIAAVDRVEVIRGGGSDLFGSAASSGAIQLLRSEARDRVVADLSAGSDDTHLASASAAMPAGALSLRFSGESFSTAGYTPVAERGSVDVDAGVERSTVEAAVETRSDDAPRAFVRLAFFDEERSNGTQLQVNSTSVWSAASGIDFSREALFASLRAYGSNQDYDQTFSAVASDRESERLTRIQNVPSTSFGISGYGTTDVTWYSRVAFGGELRKVEGRSDEEIIGTSTMEVSAGGTQQTASLFVEQVATLQPLTLVLSGRYDRWSNSDASRRTNGARVAFPTREEDAFSPRVALSYRWRDHMTLTASAYDAFRAPTLNELYRSFRVGNVLTNANENLEAEKLRGFEAGARYEGLSYVLRATLFRMTTRDPVANVTISSAPALIQRQRQNLGRTRTSGIELDAEHRIGNHWRVSAGYLYSDAEVVDFSENPAVEGNRLPHVPRHQGSLRLSYSGLAGSLVASDVRWSGEQFEDDRNQLTLGGFTTVDLFASKLVTPRWSAYGAVENVLNEEIEVGRTPVTTLGQPRAWRFGARYTR